LALFASLSILANYHLPLSGALCVLQIMITREERSRKIKKNLAIKKFSITSAIAIFVALIIVSYLNKKDSDVVLIDSWHECIPNLCKYKLTINNTSNLRKSAFVRINAFYRKSHPDGGDTFPVVNSDRLEINLEQNEQQIIEGDISVPFKASFVKFTVGDI